MTGEQLPLVHLRHARMIRRPNGRPLCRGGIEAWCARHSITWADFAGPGIPGERIVEIGDPYAMKLLVNAREEAKHGRQQ